MAEIKEIRGGVTAPKGFKAAAAKAEIKYKNRDDMAMIYSDAPCRAAGAFTSNKVKAACVLWDKEIVDSGRNVHSIVANAGIANACTGEEGTEACRKTSEAAERLLKTQEGSTLVASTGVIGMQLPVDKLIKGVELLSAGLSDSEESGTRASKAIMTTDTINKEAALSFTIKGKEVRIGGMCKGSGMIHPDMCTMLAFFTTDINIKAELLKKAVKEVVDATFNMITVDGDTSTNDTFLVMANGLSGNELIEREDEDYNTFKEALFRICRKLARRMAGDGEGATKLFEVKVINAKSLEDARLLARSVVGSNLSKAAIFGCDANFGRFLCAMGYSKADFDQKDVVLSFTDGERSIKVFDHGNPVPFDEEAAAELMKGPEVGILIDMNEGSAEAEAWGCDLTYDYVKINADYRS